MDPEIAKYIVALIAIRCSVNWDLRRKIKQVNIEIEKIGFYRFLHGDISNNLAAVVF